MDSKQVKRQKSKLKNQNSIGNSTNKPKKKSIIKRATENQKLKDKIIKYFSILGKEYLNKNEVKWIFLNLNYSSYEAKQIINQMSCNDKGFENQLYSSYQVYNNCLQRSPKPNWKKQCFQRLVQGKQTIQLQDLQQAYNYIDYYSKLSMTNESLIELMQLYGSKQQRNINLQNFQKFLNQSNPFCP